jgi:hypothetical protein
MRKWALILLIACWALVMVGLPGFYDSRKTALAWRQYHDSPGEATLRQLQDAKRSERWQILVCELILAGVVVWPVLAVIRLDRRAP